MKDNELQMKVEHWLHVVGSTPVNIDDPASEWHLTFDYPIKSEHRLHAVAPAGKLASVVLASVIQVSEDHRAAFERLDEEDRRSFLYELTRALNNVEVDFQMTGMQGPLDCPRILQVSATRYADGLTTDSFLRSLGAVYKTEFAAASLINYQLSNRGGPVDQIDFKRLAS